MPLDQVFNLLHQEYGKDAVNKLVTERLQVDAACQSAEDHHNLIKRISSSPNGVPQIVTTNFDRLFEAGDAPPRFHVPPDFPDLAFGTSIEGITYLHGRLVEAEAPQPLYVLSSADFGRAYLSEAWATNFIRNLLERYTVVLVGYRADDPPIKYLLQGLNHDGQYDRSRLFAFDRGTPEDIEAKWRDRGVTAIAYAGHEHDHKHLWQTMEAWAARADDPRAWRASVIEFAQQDPKSLLAHQRGQVAHVLRSVPGAKLFTEAQPPAHPEWVCVMDANVRSAKETHGYGDDAETFDPRNAYGLDDDQPHIPEEERQRGGTNDNLLVWRHGDENPHDAHRLGERPAEGYENIPPRLMHLISWIEKNVHSPVLAWWVIRQNCLHPCLLQVIEWRIAQMPDLHEQARHTWNLIIEHHRNPRNRQFDVKGWLDVKERIAAESWTASVLRDFGRIYAPRIEIKPPDPYSLAGVRPPSRDWGDLSLADLGQFEVKFLERHEENLQVPDDMLAQVFGLMQQGMVAASSMLADIGKVNFTTPTFYPEREVDGDKVDSGRKVMTLFIKLFNRLAEHDPDVAMGHVLTWPDDDRFFFSKLKLYAFSKTALFASDDVAARLLALDQDIFWDTDVLRELVFLMVDRWATFTGDEKAALGERILDGPDKATDWSDEEYPGIRHEFAARYARYLELQGCALTESQSGRLVEITSGIKHWNDRWATSTFTQRRRVGLKGTDEAPDALLDIPVSEVITRAKEDMKRDFGSITAKRPFTGLVKAKPAKALSSLTIAAKSDDYPQELWTALINMPEDVPPRLRRVFLHRLTRLPNSVVKELRHTMGRWIEKHLEGILEFDDDLGRSVFDHIVNGIIDGGSEAAESGLGEVRQGGEVIQKSRRTYGHAINGPLGICAGALLQAVPGEKQEAGSLIPEHIKTRLERLFASSGEGSDHAVSIAMSKLNWLMHVDPTWTENRLVPMLAFEHPAAEPAWNGFLHSGRVPSPPLANLIKPLLLKLLPWVRQQHWDRDLSTVAAQWLGNMCVFNRDEPHGLTRKEMRNVLRSMSDDTRNDFIFWLGKVGQRNDDDWTKLVVPFMHGVWPRERRYRTVSSIQSWIDLLGVTGENFPAVYASVKQFLVPIGMCRYLAYRFTDDLDDKTPLTAQFPDEILDMVNRVTPTALTRPPYELPKILALIAEVAPALTSDHRYLRLIDLVERS